MPSVKKLAIGSAQVNVTTAKDTRYVGSMLRLLLHLSVKREKCDIHENPQNILKVWQPWMHLIRQNSVCRSGEHNKWGLSFELASLENSGTRENVKRTWKKRRGNVYRI